MDGMSDAAEAVSFQWVQLSQTVSVGIPDDDDDTPIPYWPVDEPVPYKLTEEEQ